ncbi:hypothetical protein GUA87_11985 [Sneathiella sp. P13V-1]|uniref:OmpH family outer membrane protein n=1 Tax=Sneathiella sp. P13V-1 TaxID=2697366 RepID=UPI00187B5B0B|nr:OmpH family outer membrane protein [Sneathiella sp. P13V-1]MBE7637568.1 hypothetical protein [Sneathiella sp. P13V-1]
MVSGIRKVILFAVAIIAFGPMYAEAAGQRIAIIDLGQVLVDSPAMKDIDRQLKELDAKLRSDAKAKEENFRDRQLSLNQQRAILAPEQFSQKQNALSIEMRDSRNEFQMKFRQLAASRAEALKKIEKAMEPIVSKVAKQVGATIILERKQVIFVSKELNITAAVSKDLNRKLTKLPLKLVPLKK